MKAHTLTVLTINVRHKINERENGRRGKMGRVILFRLSVQTHDRIKTNP